MIDVQRVKLEISKIDASNGIRIAELVRKSKLIPNKDNNREVAKLLSSMNWTRGETKYSSKGDRYYLWFAPNVRAVELSKEQEEISTLTETVKSLQMELNRAKVENAKLQKKLDMALIDAKQLRSRMVEDMERMIEIAARESEGTGKPQQLDKTSSPTLKDFQAFHGLQEEEDDFDRRLKIALTFAE